MQLLLRYTQALIIRNTGAYTAVCNRHHSVDQQLCRWLLLSLDRLQSNELSMTQELIANMLGVRREGVTEAAGKLQTAGLIRYLSAAESPFWIAPAWEARSCEAPPSGQNRVRSTPALRRNLVRGGRCDAGLPPVNARSATAQTSLPLRSIVRPTAQRFRTPEFRERWGVTAMNNLAFRINARLGRPVVIPHTSPPLSHPSWSAPKLECLAQRISIIHGVSLTRARRQIARFMFMKSPGEAGPTLNRLRC